MQCLSFIFVLLLSLSVYARKPISGSRIEQLSGVKRSGDTQTSWDSRYDRKDFVYGKAPAKFLAENYDFIPHGSSVLDMGMGEGRNAVFLAQKGYVVTGIDISSVAVKKARILAKEYNVKLQTVVASLDKYRIKDGSFDSIIVFYYVDRTLIDKMMNWLKPGGILIYEAYTIEQRKKESFKDDPEEYFLKPQELLSMFKNIKILKYEEPEHSKDKRASIILKKL